MLPLKSSWEIAIAAGEPHSTIRVQNLQSVVQVGRDAWGRTGKAQPILISATVSLREPFDKASTEDSVNNSSTVHYGILSKAILDAVESFSSKDPNHTLRALLTHILCHLTGAGLDAEESSSSRVNPSPVLEGTALKSLELKLVLPKASLIGSGVALSGTVLYAGSGNAEAHSTSLKLCGLRIPTLIGVNPNERLAKQIVVTNIELDLWSATSDLYNELEEVVVKTVEESYFRTLETLATHVSHRVIKYFLVPTVHKSDSSPRERIKICFEKPTAVTFADAPAVEILVDSDATINNVTRELLQSKIEKKKPPFPLEKRLDQWIQENGYETKSSS